MLLFILINLQLSHGGESWLEDRTWQMTIGGNITYMRAAHMTCKNTSIKLQNNCKMFFHACPTTKLTDLNGLCKQRNNS